MLHSNVPRTDITRGLLIGSPREGAGEGDLGEMVNFALGFLQRRYLLIALTTALALALCGIYLRVTPPIYTGQVHVLLGNAKAQFDQQQSLLAEPALDLTQIETQLQILKSRAIALAVIEQLKLADDPDFNGSMPSLASIWERFRASPPPSEPPSEPADQQSAGMIRAFQDRLQASRVGFSNVIEISFNSSRAAAAAEIANAVANAYITDQMNAKFEANRSATAWLQDRLRELSDQALTAERAVNAYKSQNNIVSSGGNSVDDQQVTDLSTRLVAARAQTSDALARLDRYEAILAANSENSPSIGTLDAAGSDALNSPIINNLRQQYLDLARRESEWSARFGRDHLAVVNLRSRMRDIRTSILDEARRLAESSRSDYEVAKQRWQEIEKQLNEAVSLSRTTSSAEVTLRELESRAKGYRSLYDAFQQRYMAAVQQESFPISETRVISPAEAPEGKSKPKTKVILALGVFGGVALGIALGLFRDLMDRVFRTSAQVEAALQLPCLSLVPLLRAPKKLKASSARPQQPDENLRQRTLSTRSSTNPALTGLPSRFTEAIRSIKLGIDLNPTKTSSNVIGITSAVPNEGKTTIAASLAELVAHSGKSVIIVDCDLRNPSLSAILAPNAAAGIVEVVSGAQSLEETVWRDPKTNLVFLPAGRRGSLPQTGEILSTDATGELLARLRATYDYVIVDLPPLSPVVDVRAMASLIDGFILVVEWGRTKIDVVQHALHTAPNIHESLIGAVLNKTDIKAMGRYDFYRKDCYSGKY